MTGWSLFPLPLDPEPAAGVGRGAPVPGHLPGGAGRTLGGGGGQSCVRVLGKPGDKGLRSPQARTQEPGTAPSGENRGPSGTLGSVGQTRCQLQRLTFTPARPTWPDA